jgi:hypothetical protein
MTDDRLSLWKRRRRLRRRDSPDIPLSCLRKAGSMLHGLLSFPFKMPIPSCMLHKVQYILVLVSDIKTWL